MTNQRIAAIRATPPLSARDHAVVDLVGKFRQMTTGQIRDSLFHELASSTPLDRTLKRLIGQKYLDRLRRLAGGDQGGSAQFVYQLGRGGWRLLDRPGAYWAPRAVNLHTLAIADCYSSLKVDELAGDIEVITFQTEPDCHRAVGDIKLTPDAYVEIGYRAEGVKRSFFLEVDRATEHINRIEDKCVRYWRAFQAWADEFFPMVVFAVPDERRAREILAIVNAGPIHARKLLKASVADHLTTSIVLSSLV